MKNQGAESVDVNATTGQDGATSGTFSKNAATSQRMAAGAGSGIDGAQVLIPAGGLSIDVNVTMGQGANNASDALAAALGLGAGFSGSGQPVVLSSTPPTDVSNPMQITLPPPSGASLWFNLAGDENWAVIYESLKVGENGTFYSGIIPRSEFTVKDGKVVLTAKHFGTYQTVIPKVEVKAKIELPGRAVDLASSVTIKAPTLSQFGTSNRHNDPDKKVTITFTGDPEKLKDKFKEYRYTVDGTKPSCTEGLASSELTSNIEVTWGSVPVVFRAVACTVSGAASPVAEATYIFDNTAPIATISGPPAGTKVKFGESVSFDITYSEPVVGILVPAKIDIAVPPGSQLPTVDIIEPASQSPKVRLSNFGFDGTITVKILASAVVDAAGNPNAVSGTSQAVTIAAIRPSVSFTSITPSNTSSGNYIGTSDKPTVKGALSADGRDVQLYFDQNCSVGQEKSALVGKSVFEGSGAQLSSSVTENVFIEIYAKATDTDDNSSVCTRLVSYKWDRTAPTVAISSVPGPDPTNSSAITLTFLFSEPVTGFTVSGVNLTNATSGALTQVSSSEYRLAITATNREVSASVPANSAVDTAGNNNIASTPWSIVYDATAPTLAITSNRDPGPTNNSAITLTFTFSEPVTGFDVGDVTLTNAGKGTFTPTSSTVYTLALSNPVGNISANVGANAATDAAGNGSIISPTWSLIYDNTAPSVSKVFAVPAAAKLKAGQSIDIYVEFDEDLVVSTGATPKISLTVGTSVSTEVACSQDSNPKKLKCSYTVSPGHSSPDLDYVGQTSLFLSAGNTVKDAAGNNALLTLPNPGAGSTGSLANTSNIVVDTTAPTVVEVFSTITDGSYNVGVVIPIIVKFAEVVAVNGKPQITLNTGATSAVVDYTSGDNTDTLRFTYTVAANHSSADLDYVATSSLSFNGGTIADAAGNNADLTLPQPGQAKSLGANNQIQIDTTSPSAGTFSNSSNVTSNSLTLNWSKSTDGTGTLQAHLEYVLCKASTSAAIDTAEECLNNANKIMDWTKDIATYSVSGLTASTTYYFNVAVRDKAGNRSVYNVKSETTTSGGGGGTTVYGDLSSSHERKVVFDGTRYWAFWRSPDGLKYGYYGTGGALTVIASPVLSGVQKFSVVGKSINSSYQIVIAYSEDGTSVKLIAGTVSGTTVSWGAANDIFTGTSAIKYSNPSVIFATDDRLVVAASQESHGLFEVNVKKSTAVYTSTAPGNFPSAGLKTPHKLSSFGSLALAPLGVDNFNVTISGADGAMVSYEGVFTAGSLTDFVPGITSSITSRPTSLLMAGRAGVSLSGNESYASVNVMKVIAGELYIGGQFDSVGGIAANNVAKWNGWRWLPLGSGVSGPVNAIQEFNGKIFVGGLFSSAGNTAAQNIAAWDGRAWWAPGGVVDAAILAMAVSNNELFVGGAFSKFKDSTSLGRLVKTSDGGTWTSAASDVFPSGFAVTALHDVGGALYAAGYNVNTGLSSLAKYTTIWSTPILLTGEIKAMASDATHLYLVGGITAVSGENGLPALNKMVKVTHSGTAIWSCVGTCSDFSPGSGSVNGVLVEGSAVYVVGDFVSQIKVYEAGNWSDVGYGLGGGPAKTLVRQAGKLIVGGIFKEAYNSLQESGKVLSKGIASFESAKWSAMGAGFTKPVRKVLNLGTNNSLVWTAGAGYLGGVYSSSGLFVYNDSAGWTSMSLPSGLTGQANLSDVVFDLGKVYVAFSIGTNDSESKVFSYDGTKWVQVGTGLISYRVQQLIVGSGFIYVLGRQVDIGGSSSKVVIHSNTITAEHTDPWNSMDTLMGPQLMEDINDAVKIWDNFYVAHSAGVSYLTSSGWISVSSTQIFTGPVYSLAFSGANGTGSLVAGGTFKTLHNGSTNPVFNNLAAINLSSGVPEGFWVPIGAAANVGVVCSSTPCVASVNSLEFSGTQLYVGGRFDKVDGTIVSPNVAQVSLTSGFNNPSWTAIGYEAPLSSVSIGSINWFGGAFGIARPSTNILAKVTSFSAISSGSSSSLVYGDAVIGDLRRADYTGSQWTLSVGPISDANSNSNWPSFVNVGGTSTNYVVTWTTNGKLYYRKYTGTWAGIMSLTTFIDVSSPSISLDFATSGQIPVTFSRGNGFTTIESAQIP